MAGPKRPPFPLSVTGVEAACLLRSVARSPRPEVSLVPCCCRVSLFRRAFPPSPLTSHWWTSFLTKALWLVTLKSVSADDFSPLLFPPRFFDDVGLAGEWFSSPREVRAIFFFLSMVWLNPFLSDSGSLRFPVRNMGFSFAYFNIYTGGCGEAPSVEIFLLLRVQSKLFALAVPLVPRTPTDRIPRLRRVFFLFLPHDGFPVTFQNLRTFVWEYVTSLRWLCQQGGPDLPRVSQPVTEL